MGWGVIGIVERVTGIVERGVIDIVECGVIGIVERGVIDIVEWGVIGIVERGVIDIVERGVIGMWNGVSCYESSLSYPARRPGLVGFRR